MSDYDDGYYDDGYYDEADDSDYDAGDLDETDDFWADLWTEVADLNETYA